MPSRFGACSHDPPSAETSLLHPPVHFQSFADDVKGRETKSFGLFLYYTQCFSNPKVNLAWRAGAFPSPLSLPRCQQVCPSVNESTRNTTRPWSCLGGSAKGVRVRRSATCSGSHSTAILIHNPKSLLPLLVINHIYSRMEVSIAVTTTSMQGTTPRRT